ncbi:DNA-binding Lrp family transcriptional regulator [Microbacterium resistens]|uniref:DNA-binding Lrp family transcriptional regulator n=1 Tax=Microbacterium resistens TaxID=156977 RepID=A0ABU1S9Y9_9MICO|nr:Lrp/AsnC family transcriptional regulator [Microbacterium resistens]MDR6866420.1 DNA-binding Lrp family transcriptional regulator [Microbacterium resistens]
MTLAGVDRAFVQAQLFGATELSALGSGHLRFSDDDLAVVAALQHAPRASWREIGETLGVSASTAARRWDRLVASGLAWITAYPSSRFGAVAYVRIQTTAARFQAVAVEFAISPFVFWLEQTDGSGALFAGVAARSFPRLREILDLLAETPGVLSITSSLSVSTIREGDEWLPDTVRAPVASRIREAQTADGGAVARFSDAELALFEELYVDGRASYTRLAARSGMSERTVRRWLPEQLESGRVRVRCDVARERLGYQLGVLATIDAGRNWESLAQAVLRWSSTRMIAYTSGSSPLLLHSWVRSPGEWLSIEQRIREIQPATAITEVTFTLRSLKRFGQLFAPDGTTSGQVRLARPSGTGSAT